MGKAAIHVEVDAWHRLHTGEIRKDQCCASWIHFLRISLAQFRCMHVQQITNHVDREGIDFEVAGESLRNQSTFIPPSSQKCARANTFEELTWELLLSLWHIVKVRSVISPVLFAAFSRCNISTKCGGGESVCTTISGETSTKSHVAGFN